MLGVELIIGVDEGEVWARDSGGGGSPLVLLHPGWGDSSIWDPMVDLLDQLPGRYRCIRYDTRGFGRSPAPAAPFSQLADLTAVLDYLQVEQAALVGHSGGGGTAIGLALAQPQRVSALILAAPGLQDYPWPQDDPYGGEIEKLFASGDQEGLVALGLRTWAAAGADPAAEAQIRAAVTAFRRMGEHERPDPSAYPRLGELTVPAVLAIGDLDYPMVRECGQAIADRIPGCSTVLVPGADHMLPLRVPALLVDLIDRYRPE
jgi:3-oxoadipate enol-lactonase